MQIQGSGTGNYASTAIVDTSIDAQHGRLWTSTSGAVALASGTNIVDVDTLSSALATIDVAHGRIHQGVGYEVSRFTSSLANGGSADIYFVVGAGANPHITYSVSSAGDSTLEIFEQTEVSNSGTSVTSFNFDRTSSNTTDSKIFHTPTITSSGTLLIQDLVPGGTKQQAIGGISPDRQELILHTGSTYLFRIINRAGASKDVSANISYYEVDV